jgi:methylglutaconyl-CoA hydratase
MNQTTTPGREARIATETDRRGVTTVWIDNPDHRNALNDALIEGLIDAFDQLGRQPGCRAIVLRGRGGIFCAGRELRDLRRLQAGSFQAIEQTYERLRRLNEVVYHCPRPTVCVIESYAFGAGATIASWCDMVLGAEEAFVCYPEVQHGIAPTPAVMALLRGIGRKAAMDLLMTGRRVAMAEAVRLGLATRGVPQAGLDDALAEVIIALVRAAPEALQRTRAFIWQCEDTPLAASMAGAVAPVSASVAADEARDGAAAFLERRHPYWVA